MINGVNYVIHGCYSARTTPEVTLFQNVTFKENTVAVITQNRVLKMTIWKGKLKTKLCVLVDCSY